MVSKTEMPMPEFWQHCKNTNNFFIMRPKKKKNRQNGKLDIYETNYVVDIFLVKLFWSQLFA